MAKSKKAAAAIAAHFAEAPGADLDEFMKVGVEADRSLSDVGRRSFNATYMLPLKRAANPKPRRKKAAGPTKGKGAAERRQQTGSRGPRVSAAARAATRELVLGRDQQVLAALESGGDPVAAYKLGAEVDRYIDHLAAALKK